MTPSSEKDLRPTESAPSATPRARPADPDMIACAGTVTFLAFSLFFLLALVLMRAGIPGSIYARPAARHVLLVRAQTPPYDWEREGI